MNCFGGLQYAILISFILGLIIMSLPSFLNLLARVRKYAILSFLAHFGLHILCFCVLIYSFLDNSRYVSIEDIVLLLPCLFWLSWIITYRKLRKFVNSNL